MSLRLIPGLALLIAALAMTASAGQPAPAPAPDEKCIEDCDEKSDQCMQDSGGDPDKMRICDDKYSECLQACPA